MLTNMDHANGELMVTMTDQELEDHFRKPKKYSAIEIASSVAELRSRGKFDELKLPRILEIIRRKLIDEDPKTPTYYTPDTIVYVSIFSLMLFSSILLALNVKNRWDRCVIIGFGITYTFFIFTVVSLVELHPTTPSILNLAGGMMLKGFVWDRFIGKDARYKRKSILIPCIIVIMFLILFFCFVYIEPTFLMDYFSFVIS